MTSVAPAPDGAGPNEPPAEAPAPDEETTSWWRTPWVVAAFEWIVVIAGAVAVAVLIQVTSVQAFYIPSRSMAPTLEVNDRVLVNKWSYRLHDVNRGDIVVFERPEGETSDIKDLVKRVIALPGESVSFVDDKVLIDGHVLDEPYLPDGTVTNDVNSPIKCTAAAPCVVPEGDVWVMGDNRTDSKDSRWFNAIPESKIVGRAFFRVWPPGRIGSL